MSIMIDCTASPSIDALNANDVSVVARYLSWMFRWNGVTHDYPNPKILLEPELARLHLAGKGVLPNWEFDARDALGGSSNGKAMAQEAVKQLRALGISGVAVPASYDWDVQLSEWNGAAKGFATEYANVMRGEGFHPGGYGPYDLLTWITDAGLSDIQWQSMSTAHSGHRNANQHSLADIWQKGHKTVGGVDTDWNLILTGKLSQLCWGGSSTPIVNPPKPGYEQLLVDGRLGFHTISRLQQKLATPVDGVVSLPPARSSVVGALQVFLNNVGARDANGRTLAADYNGYSLMPQDGHRTHTIEALQRRMGTGVDGYLSTPSGCVAQMQKRLNDNWL